MSQMLHAPLVSWFYTIHVMHRHMSNKNNLGMNVLISRNLPLVLIEDTHTTMPIWFFVSWFSMAKILIKHELWIGFYFCTCTDVEQPWSSHINIIELIVNLMIPMRRGCNFNVWDRHVQNFLLVFFVRNCGGSLPETVGLVLCLRVMACYLTVPNAWNNKCDMMGWTPRGRWEILMYIVLMHGRLIGSLLLQSPIPRVTSPSDS